jgi:hypothetical protein
MVAVLNLLFPLLLTDLHWELDALGARDFQGMARHGSDAGEDADQLCNFDSIDKTCSVLTLQHTRFRGLFC